MSDIVNSEVRSRMMSGIRCKDTKPEIIIRHHLHALGYRYLLHDKRKPGKPDMVFPKYNAVIFVHGCFWHGHDCCLFKWPQTNQDFWRIKIEKNKQKDIENHIKLINAGWRVMVIWECALKGRSRMKIDKIIQITSEWLCSSELQSEIRSKTGVH
ncbi:MAG: very short patch repair endonuclease [Peptococcaceae bacterium]